MNFYVQFQEMGENGRPIDHPDELDINVSSEQGGAALIPNVGDFVSLDGKGSGDAPGFSGVVRTRYFRYIRVEGQNACQVNIVVEKSDQDWGELIKE